jgi:hypothetical protein
LNFEWQIRQDRRSGELFGLSGAVVGVLGDMAGVRFEEPLSWLENGIEFEKAKLVC